MPSVHLILYDMITLIILCEAYKLWSSSLCSILQLPASFSLLGRESGPLSREVFVATAGKGEAAPLPKHNAMKAQEVQM